MKNNKGITLIALVITIIVLLILAGVSISTIAGENGILKKAKAAKENTNSSQEKELIDIAVSSAKLNNTETLEITEENLEKELDKVLGKRDEKYTLTKEGTNYVVKCIESGRSYIIEGKGEGNGIEKVEPANIDDWEYELNEEAKTAVITKYKGTDTEVVIPNYIEDYRVIAIEPKGDCGLWDKSICVSTTVSGYECNYYQETITKIVVSEGIETIGAKSFWYSTNLQECIIKEGTKTIGDRIFYYCLNLIEFKIPNSVVTVGDELFLNCRKLEKIYIPKSVVTVSPKSFYKYSNSLTIYYEGRPMEWNRLNTTISSNTIIIYGGTEKVEPTNIDDWEYELNEEAKTAVITKYKGTDTEVVIPNYIEDYRVIAIEPKGDCGLWDKSICVSTTVSGYECNYYQETITKIVVSEGIETIGAKSFWYSVNLQECIIKDGTKVIGDYAFYYCKSLKDIEMPETLEKIASYSFYYCISLEDFVIPSSVTTIGSYALWYGYGLKNIYIPKSVVTIANKFFYCPNNVTIYYEGSQAEWGNLHVSVSGPITVLYNCDMNV